jgi:uncharacterized phage protein gp47/JayE
MSDTITVSSPATATEVAVDVLAYQGAQSGVASDTNPGSQLRTLSEAFGEVAEVEGVTSQALAFQAMVYGAFSAFGIVPFPASQAQGTITFLTGTGISPPPASQNVTIPAGTIAQTTGGVQYVTTETVTLLISTTSITATAEALVAGASGNTSTGTVTQLVSSVPYPLFVTNPVPFVNGANAESPAATLARFTAKVASIGLASPVAIANAAIGIQAPNSTETVLYSTLYEPWVTQPPDAQTASWILYIDNGSGAASDALIAQVIVVLDGSQALNQSGFRDAGVPFQVLPVVPVDYSVVVTATLINSTNAATLDAAVQQAVQQYEAALQFGQSVQVTQLIAAVGAVLVGYITAFDVVLLDSLSNPQQVIAVSSIERGILTNLTTTLT